MEVTESGVGRGKGSVVSRGQLLFAAVAFPHKRRRAIKQANNQACAPLVLSHPDASPPPSPAPPPPTPPLPPRPRPLVLLPFLVAVNPPSEVSSSADDVADVNAAGDAIDPDDEEDEEGRLDATTRSLLDTVCTETGAWMLSDRSEQRRFRNATRWHLGRRGKGGCGGKGRVPGRVLGDMQGRSLLNIDLSILQSVGSSMSAPAGFLFSLPSDREGGENKAGTRNLRHLSCASCSKYNYNNADECPPPPASNTTQTNSQNDIIHTSPKRWMMLARPGKARRRRG